MRGDQLRLLSCAHAAGSLERTPTSSVSGTLIKRLCPKGYHTLPVKSKLAWGGVGGGGGGGGGGSFKEEEKVSRKGRDAKRQERKGYVTKGEGTRWLGKTRARVRKRNTQSPAKEEETGGKQGKVSYPERGFVKSKDQGKGKGKAPLSAIKRLRLLRSSDTVRGGSPRTSRGSFKKPPRTLRLRKEG